MARKFAVYKGLERPLIFKGFKGKYIYWGLASLLSGLVFGALTMSLVNMWLGAMVLIGFTVGGLLYCASRQKGGLHAKSRNTNVLILYHHGRKNHI